MFEVLDFFNRFFRDSRERVRYQYAILAAIPILSGCLWVYWGVLEGAVSFGAALWILVGPRIQSIIRLTVALAVWVVILHVQNHLPSIPAKIRGLSAEVTEFQAGRKVEVRTDLGNFRLDFGRTSVEFHWGETIRIWGSSVEAPGPTNPGEFDMRRFLRSKNIRGMVRCDSVVRIRAPDFFHRWINRARGTLLGAVDDAVPGEAASIAKAALLGSRTSLDPEIKEAFSNSGMYHLLAISGLHVGIIAMILSQLLLAARVPVKAAYWLTAFILTFYVCVTGFQISVTRTVIMFWALIPSIQMDRPRFSLNNLALAALLCLLLMPYQVLSMGFQLSFTATFFLLYYSRLLNHLCPFKWAPARAATSIVLVSGLLFAATYPILSNTLHQISPLAVPGNMATIFFTAVLVYSGMCALIFSFVSVSLSHWMGETCALAARALTYSVERLSEWPGSYLAVVSPHWTALVLVFGGLIILPFAWRVRRGRRTFLVLCLLFAASWGIKSIYTDWVKGGQVTFLDVGQGDAAVLELPGRFTVLIDAGKGSLKSGMGRNVLLPFLKHSGINRIDQVHLTHGDLDHFGGLLYLASRIPIGAVLYSGTEAKSQSWNRLRQILKECGIPFLKVQCGAILYTRGSSVLEVLSPCRAYQFSGKNDNSLVAKLRIYGKTILFSGDIERRAEEWVSHREGLSADILKVPHHGSNTSSSNTFLNTVNPQIAVISAGVGNSYGLPHPLILRRLRGREITLWNTQWSGAIQYRVSHWGENWIPFITESKNY